MKNMIIFTLFFLIGFTALSGAVFLGLATKNSLAKDNQVTIEASEDGVNYTRVEPAAGPQAIDRTMPQNGGDLMPAVTNDDTGSAENITATHSILRLTPDRTELIDLDADAQSIIVGNPAHASVLMDSPRKLLVVPKSPGATHFSVLGKSGDVIMQRHVIVASQKEKYVRIRRSCANGNRDCRPTSVYYCPDTCHEVLVDNE